MKKLLVVLCFALASVAEAQQTVNITASGNTPGARIQLGPFFQGIGTTADAAVGDATGTINSHARFIAKALGDVWNTGTHTLGVNGSVSLTGTLPAFAATPAFTISGTLPAFASTPTVNVGGTLPAFAATPAVTISGTLPAFAATPTVNANITGNALAGATPVTLTGINATFQTVIAASHIIDSVVCDNNNAAWTYLHFYDNAAPTVGTTATRLLVPLSPSVAYPLTGVNVAFATAITVAATLNPTSSTMSPATTTIACTIGYR